MLNQFDNDTRFDIFINYFESERLSAMIVLDDELSPFFYCCAFAVSMEHICLRRNRSVGRYSSLL